MAATSTSSSADAASPPPQTSTPDINIRNPTPLSATQEAQVRDIYYKRVRGHCAAEIKGMSAAPEAYNTSFYRNKEPNNSPEFAACAINRTISATWVCRQQRLAMNSCMVAHAKPEEEDRAREEWFAGRDERRRARIKAEKDQEERRTQIISMMREDAARQKEEAEAKKRRG
ncbi:hypothetical protein FQN54_000176 [Arachnomyces sp. PD_36]|nr:hypothetical protein FQN54_000176 [Arachnomyces sp. PD_36]